MLNLSMGSLFGGLLFGSAGFVLFRWGRQRNNIQWVILGIALMTYTLFVSSTTWVWIIGSALCGYAYLTRYS